MSLAITHASYHRGSVRLGMPFIPPRAGEAAKPHLSISKVRRVLIEKGNSLMALTEQEMLVELRKYDTPSITNVVATYPGSPLCLGLYNPWTENWYTDTTSPLHVS